MFFFLFLLFATYAGCIPSTLDGPFRPASISFNCSLLPGSDDLPADDPRFKQQDPASPEQISLALSTPDSMWVSWVTGEAKLVAGPVTPLDTAGDSVVLYSDKQHCDQPKVAIGYSQVYSQEYPFEGLLNYTSGVIHHVRLTGLLPSTTYYYSCGNGVNMSRELNFTTLPAVEAMNYPARIGIVGDLGLTSNSSTTVDHLMYNNPDLFLIVGDLSYADDYVTNGTGASCYSCTFPDAPTKETYQPRWDYWGRFMEKLISRVPMMAIAGNHELEPQVANKVFESYKARIAVPWEESGSPSKLFYSFNTGGIHFVMLGSYVDFSQSSEQYAWLEKDLASVDRNVTPWLIATFHAPWYNSYKAHYREGECMRQSMESLLYKYKVDMVFSGHVHAYERSNRVYNYALDPCGPVHITMGDGGNIETLARDFADTPGMCPSPDKVKSFSGKNCLFNFTEPEDAKGQFCWSRQPDWSALRDPSFGHGILEVKNQTHALWTWHRNQDAFSGDTQGDQVYIVRQPELCLSQVPAPTPAPSPSPNAALTTSSSLLLIFAVFMIRTIL